MSRRLARVQAVRAAERKVAAEPVRRLVAELAVERSAVTAARAAETTARASAESAAQAGITGDELVRWWSYADALAAQALAGESVCRRLEDELARARAGLLVRRTAEKQIERLITWQKDAARVAAARAEAAHVDDLVGRLERRMG